MPGQSDEEESQLPSHSDHFTLANDKRKCGAENIPFSGEGSSSVSSPFKQIKFEKRGRDQDQRAQCASLAHKED